MFIIENYNGPLRGADNRISQLFPRNRISILPHSMLLWSRCNAISLLRLALNIALLLRFTHSGRVFYKKFLALRGTL